MMNISLWSLLVCVVPVFTKATGDIDTSICQPTAKAVPPPPPDLAPSYSTTVEWKLIHQNSTVIINEYVDGIQKQSGIEVTKEGVTSQMIFDEVSGLYFTIDRVDFQRKRYRCSTQNYYTHAIQTGDELWETTTKQLYDTFRRVPLVYNGTDFIRSTYVELWTSCFYLFLQQATLEMRMYFAVDGWPMPMAPPNARVPVRMEIIGNQNGSYFHVVGDYINFTPSPQFDLQSVQPPPGTYCPGRVSLKQILPPPETFTSVIERVDMDNEVVTFQNIWFDSARRYVRIDKKSAAGNDADPESYIHDFQSGIRYNIDPYLVTCKADVIQNGDDFVKSPSIKGTVQMQTSEEFFQMKNANPQYVGKRRARNIMCDVWVGTNFNSLVNRNQTIEWYFMEDGWIEAAGLSLTPGSLVRYDIWVGDVDNPIVHHVHQIDPSQPYLSVFDISNCYDPISRYHFMIKFAVSGRGSLRDVSQSFLADDMQFNLANVSFLNPIRISRAATEHFNDREFFFSGIIVDKPPFENDLIFPPPPMPIALDGAFGFLRGVISTPWVHNVTSSAGQEVMFTSVGITTIDFQTQITTTTTLPTTSGTFLIPTLPKTGPTTTLKVPPSPSPQTQAPKSSLLPTTKQTFTTQLPTTKLTNGPQGTVKPQTQAPCVCNVTCPVITTKPTPPPVRCPSTKPPPPATNALSTTSKAPPTAPVIHTTMKSSMTASQTTTTQKGLKSSSQTSNKSSGVSSGGAAGIAIAMLIVGAMIGAIVAIAFQRRFPTGFRHRLFRNPVYDEAS